MRNKRRYGTTALWVSLMLLFTVFIVILYAEVDSDMPMYERGANYERN